MEFSLRNVKDAWTARGFSCHLWRDPPGKEWINYIHDADEVIMLLYGEIEVTIDGQSTRPKIGEEILIPRQVRHSVRNVGSVENRWLYGYKIQ